MPTAAARSSMPYRKAQPCDNAAAAIFTLSITSHLYPKLHIYAALERHEDTGSNRQDSNRSNIDILFGYSQHKDIRLRYVNDVAPEFGISAGYYW